MDALARDESALPPGDRTWLDQQLAPHLDTHPDESGFHLVADGVEAFALRALTARRAERSLDVQTYIWHDRPMGRIGMDLEHPDAVPYFNWDAPVTNAAVRQALAEGNEDDKVFWTAKIMREARYDDVWKYVSLRRDVLPRWSQIEPHLGRWKDKWRFLIEGWKARGLV